MKAWGVFFGKPKAWKITSGVLATLLAVAVATIVVLLVV